MRNDSTSKFLCEDPIKVMGSPKKQPFKKLKTDDSPN